MTYKIGDIIKCDNGGLFTVERILPNSYRGLYSYCFKNGSAVTSFECMLTTGGYVIDTFGSVKDTHNRQLELPINKVCECGGYTTYHSWHDQFHSRWCGGVK